MLLHPAITDVAARRQVIDRALKDGKLDGRALTEHYSYVYKDDGSLPLLGMGRTGSYSEGDSTEDHLAFVVTVLDEDRDGDVVNPAGLELKNYQRNPVWFFGHQEWLIPIGTSRAQDGRICVFPDTPTAKAWFFPDMADEDAAFVAGKVRRGILNATSIAFVPIEAWKREEQRKAHQSQHSPAGWHFERVDLTEISIVGVPANPWATREQKQLRGALRDAVDREGKSIRPRLRKALQQYCAESTNESGGCWTGWCPSPVKEKASITIDGAAGDAYKRDAQIAALKRRIQLLSGPTLDQRPADKAKVDGWKRQLSELEGGKKDMTKHASTKSCSCQRCSSGRTCGCAKGVAKGKQRKHDEVVTKDSMSDCVSRKVPIFAREHPDWDNDRCVAAAYGWCGESKGLPLSVVKAVLGPVEEFRAKALDESSGAAGGYAVKGDNVVVGEQVWDSQAEEYAVVVSTSPLKLRYQDGKVERVNPRNVFKKSLRKRAGTQHDTEYDQGYVAAWDGRGRETNPYKNDADPAGREMSDDWLAGWRDGAKERLAGRKRLKAGGVNSQQVLDELRQMSSAYGVTYQAVLAKFNELKSKLNGQQLLDKLLSWCENEGALQYPSKSHRCTFCKGTGSGLGRAGDCPDCGGRGKIVKQKDWDSSLKQMVQNVRAKIRELKRDQVVGMSRANLRQIVSTRGIDVPPGDFDKLLDAAIEQAGAGSFIKGWKRKDLDADEMTAEKDETPASAPHDVAMAQLYQTAKDEHEYLAKAMESITPFDPNTGEANPAHKALKDYHESVGKRVEDLKAMFGEHAGGEQKDVEEFSKGMDAGEPVGLDADTGESNLVDLGEVPGEEVEADEEDGSVEMDLGDEETMALDDEEDKALGDDEEKDLDEVEDKAADEDDTEEKAEDAVDHDTEEILERYQKASDDPHGVKCPVCGTGNCSDVGGNRWECPNGHKFAKSLRKVWASRPATRQRVAKVLAAGGAVKKGRDGRRWLVVKTPRPVQAVERGTCNVCKRPYKMGDEIVANDPGAMDAYCHAQCFGKSFTKRKGLTAHEPGIQGKSRRSVTKGLNWRNDGPDMLVAQGDTSGWDYAVEQTDPGKYEVMINGETGFKEGSLSACKQYCEAYERDVQQGNFKGAKAVRRKDLTAHEPGTQGKALDPEHAEVAKAAGCMMKGLAQMPDMPEHHKMALDVVGDEMHKAADGEHDDPVGAMDKAVKHLKALSEAPDVLDHHKQAMSVHGKAMKKALKALGADEPGTDGKAEGDDVEKDDADEPVEKSEDGDGTEEKAEGDEEEKADEDEITKELAAFRGERLELSRTARMNGIKL